MNSGARVAAAERDLEEARRALALAMQAEDTVRVSRRRLQNTIDGAVAGARANLAQKRVRIGDYRAANVGQQSAPTVPSGSVTLGNALPSDLTEIDVDDMDFSDNPLVGEFGKGGALRTDYLWATETWATVIAPGMANGMDREDFARRDAARNAPAYRRTADVYDLFTGDSQIVLSRRSNGSFEVVNGRHRIAAARSLGVQSLPARIIR